jgi:hypothetical protein
MDDSLFARLGYDPVAIYTRIHGQPPASGGIVRLGPRAGPTDAEAEGQPPGAEAVPQASAAPPVENSIAPSADEPPSQATEPDPPLQGEGDHPQGGGAAPSPDPEPDRAPDQPETGRPPETIRAMRAWLDEHWHVVKAMALAGEAPQRPSPLPPCEATPAPPLPPVHVRKGDRWNKSRMVDFLRQLAATHSVSAAARSVGMSRNSAYRLRNRLKGQPFDIAWEAAFRHGYDNLAHAALDRALNGVEVPHYCNGELVGTSRKFDERLTVALLAMRNRFGAPMLGRFGAAAEYWGEHWDALLERIATGPVDWSDEQQALGEQERQRLDLPDGEREIERLIARNRPDDRGGGSAR